MKKYGIYLLYPPTVDLRKEGLGRYLAAFLKGVENKENIRFKIVCPSWSKEGLRELFESENVSIETFDILSPKLEPVVLKLHRFIIKNSGKKKKRRFKFSFVRNFFDDAVDEIIEFLIGVDSVFKAFVLLIFLLLLFPFGVVFIFIFATINIFKKITGYFFKSSLTRRIYRKINQVLSILSVPKKSQWIFKLYKKMELNEIKRIHAIIDEMDEIEAWYCPTAFWPSFNKIKAPRLMCVPDVVLEEFPIGFSNAIDERGKTAYLGVANAIFGGDNFVTYSEKVKWDTLVNNYYISPEKIKVVNHAPNKLDNHLEFEGFKEQESMVEQYCRTKVSEAIYRSFSNSYVHGFDSDNFKFIFYASQARPNKNIISLLRAYMYLLRNRGIEHKLILTGNIDAIDSIENFVLENKLTDDVRFLHGLSIKELASFYKIADLAVNPSLSEGGCPFTFTEALSVGTPVVMSRIKVAEEVIDDERVQEVTFFDPYDWMSIAHKIEWALAHKEEVLNVQLDFFKKLSTRTWEDVVSEHLDILDEISLKNTAKDACNG